MKSKYYNIALQLVVIIFIVIYMSDGVLKAQSMINYGVECRGEIESFTIQKGIPQKWKYNVLCEKNKYIVTSGLYIENGELINITYDAKSEQSAIYGKKPSSFIESWYRRNHILGGLFLLMLFFYSFSQLVKTVRQ